MIAGAEAVIGWADLGQTKGTARERHIRAGEAGQGSAKQRRGMAGQCQGDYGRTLSGQSRPALVEWSGKLFFGKCKVLMSQKLPYVTKTLYTKFELDL